MQQTNDPLNDNKSLAEILREAERCLKLVFKDPANITSVIQMIEKLKLSTLKTLITIPTAISKLSNCEKAKPTVNMHENSPGDDNFSPTNDHDKSSPATQDTKKQDANIDHSINTVTTPTDSKSATVTNIDKTKQLSNTFESTNVRVVISKVADNEEDDAIKTSTSDKKRTANVIAEKKCTTNAVITKEESKLDCQDNQSVVSSVEAITMKDPLIVIIGVGEYDRNFNHNLAGVAKDYKNIVSVFSSEDNWKYMVLYRTTDNSIVYSNKTQELEKNINKKYKLRWKVEEMEIFAEQARQKLVSQKHDGLIFVISGHGNRGNTFYGSTGKPLYLDCLSAMFSPLYQPDSYKETEEETKHLFGIPKIFLIDCCRGSGAAKPFKTTSSVSNTSNIINNTSSNTTDKKKTMAMDVDPEDTKIDVTDSRSQSDLSINTGGSTNEKFVTKGVTKEVGQKLVAEMANFCRIYANIDGCCVADGSKNGGLFLRSVCKIFRDKAFVLKHTWAQIIIKIRQYTKQEATIFGSLQHFTQLVEKEGTLERQVSFATKYEKTATGTVHNYI